MLKWILAIACSIMFFLGWGSGGLSVFFLGFFLIPLLIAEHYLVGSGLAKYSIGFASILLFHLFAGYNLINNLEPLFVIFIFTVNALIQSIPWAVYVSIKSKINLLPAVLLLIILWLIVEHGSITIGIPSPWFILGNGLYSHPELIQFYEFSGVSGGSLWILLSNCISFYCIAGIKTVHSGSYKMAKISLMIFILISPILLSKQIRFDYKARTEEVLILNTNQKDRDILGVSFYQLLEESKNNITENTKYVVWPENIFASTIQLSKVEKSRLVTDVRKYLIVNESILFICGAILSSKSELFNTALIVGSKSIKLYKKRKLVPFTEYCPRLFQSIKMFRLSDIEFTKGPDKIETESISINICYESLFGQLVSENCSNSNGRVLVIISNEFWTQGASEFLLGFCSIRAIENRKFTIRSTNNGIGSVINPNGEVERLSRTNQSVSALRADIIPNSYKTFYMRNPDLIGKLSVILLITFLPFLPIMATLRHERIQSLHGNEALF